MHGFQKMPASLWICIEIDPHSSACTKLTEIFPSGPKNYLENAVVCFRPDPVSYVEIFLTLNTRCVYL